jgi:hypothetical protein
MISAYIWFDTLVCFPGMGTVNFTLTASDFRTICFVKEDFGQLNWFSVFLTCFLIALVASWLGKLHKWTAYISKNVWYKPHLWKAASEKSGRLLSQTRFFKNVKNAKSRTLRNPHDLFLFRRTRVGSSASLAVHFWAHLEKVGTFDMFVFKFLKKRKVETFARPSEQLIPLQEGTEE